MNRPSLGFASLLGLAATLGSAPAGAVQQLPQCLQGTTQVYSANGAIATYDVPASGAAILVDTTAGSGGDAVVFTAPSFYSVSPTPPAPGFSGGLGAHLVAEVGVTGGETLHVIVGQAGADGTAGGGGGGSAVYSGAATPLVVAGGGGGAGETENGDPGQLAADGSDGGGAVGGAGGSGGAGGGATSFDAQSSGGGGGFSSAGGTNAFAGSGEGGHVLPGDAAGGAAVSGAGAGGFGGGGGAGGPGGGGGGGYSGGGGAWGMGVDGGGGSFVAAGGTTFVEAVAALPGDGEVTICVTENAVPAAPVGAIALLAGLLLAAGAWNARRLARR